MRGIFYCLSFSLTTLLTAPVLVPAQEATASDKDSRLQITRATRLQGPPPEIDGALGEDVWQRAKEVTGFTQQDPNPGQPASQKTSVYLLYDDTALYVGARLYDDPDSVAARLFRRDEDGYSDWFGVGIDGYDDDRTAFAFAVNPRGVKRDMLLFDDTRDDDSWDAVWSASAQVDSAGWTAELRIPFSQLRYPSGRSEQVWGVNFLREIARRGESSFWAPILPDASGFVSRFGQLRGMKRLTQPRNLEVEPYIASRLVRAPDEEGNPFYQANDFRAALGGDLTYSLTSNLTLTATVNPDFGQVEVDPAVINLSAYETFFPEKRSFFIEGMEAFQFGQPRTNVRVNPPFLFYSRRIGQAPQRRLRGYPYVDAPEQTTIAGAAKLSGKVGKHWGVGVLNAVTLREEARYVTSNGEEFIATVEPPTNYGVGRVRRDFAGGNAFAGGFLTTVHRGMEAGPLKALLHDAAYVGGTDFEYAWADRKWSISGYVLVAMCAARRRRSRPRSAAAPAILPVPTRGTWNSTPTAPL